MGGGQTPQARGGVARTGLQRPPPQLGNDGNTALDEVFTGLGLRTGAMGEIALMMK